MIMRLRYMDVLNGRYYLLDVFRQRLEYQDLLRAVKNCPTNHSPKAVESKIEALAHRFFNICIDGVFLLAYSSLKAKSVYSSSQPSLSRPDDQSEKGGARAKSQAKIPSYHRTSGLTSGVQVMEHGEPERRRNFRSLLWRHFHRR